MVLTTSNQDLVRPILISQLRRVALPRLELDGDLRVVEEVRALEDDAEATFANLFADAVVHADDIAAGAHAARASACPSRDGGGLEYHCQGE